MTVIDNTPVIVRPQNLSAANAATHGGVFHADDVFATVLLHELHPDWCFCRVNSLPNPAPANVLLYDIGGGAFDHHQQGFSESRPNGVKYAAFGLLWCAFGMELLCHRKASNPETVFELFDEGLVSSVDAHDNGQWKATEIPSVTVSHVISAMNPQWNEVPDFDGAFLQAFRLAERVFNRELQRCAALAEAKQRFLEASAQAEGDVLVLQTYLPWKAEWLNEIGAEHPIRRIVYPSPRGGFCVRSVGNGEASLFPKSWAGLSGPALAKASRICSAVFCHSERFLCVVETIEDAIFTAHYSECQKDEVMC